MTRHGEFNTTKETLLRTALTMIKEEGLDAFSARRLATECGLTHQAPYRYFENKEHLMGSIITEILVRMSNHVAQAVKKRKEEEPFLVIWEESIRFLVKNPNYGILLYSDESGEKSDQYGKEHFKQAGFYRNFWYISKDYFLRCGVPEEKCAAVFDVINAMMSGISVRMINRAVVVEGGLKTVTHMMIEDILHLKVKEGEFLKFREELLNNIKERP